MKEERQKHMEGRLDKLAEQVAMMMENSRHMEESFKKRMEKVEHEVLDFTEDYDDIEEDDNLQGNFYLIS